MVHSGRSKLIGTDFENNKSIIKSVKTPSYRLEANYGFAKNMEFGMYIGSQASWSFDNLCDSGIFKKSWSEFQLSSFTLDF